MYYQNISYMTTRKFNKPSQIFYSELNLKKINWVKIELNHVHENIAFLYLIKLFSSKVEQRINSCAAPDYWYLLKNESRF